MSVESSDSTLTTKPDAPLTPALAPPRPPARRSITAALMLLMVLASMEQTVTSTAMPTIIGDLHGLEWYAWVTAVYLLASTVVMPLYGRLADVWGRKRVIILAVVLFIVGSLLCSVAQTMPQLVLFRGIQGLGAGGIMPVVLTILGDLYTIQERAAIQGFFSAIWGTASLAGPILGAFLVEFGWRGWRSVFWVNLPFGLLGLLVLILVYTDRDKPHSTELDLRGITLLAASSALLLVFLGMLGDVGGGNAIYYALLPVAGVGFLLATAFFIRQEKRSTNPVMPPALLMQAAIGPAVLASFLLGSFVIGLDVWVPLYVQGGMGGTPKDAAATITPVMLGWATSAFFAAPLVVRWGFRRTATVGAILNIAGIAGLVIVTFLHAPLIAIIAVLLLAGLGGGPTSMSYLLSAQDAVAWQQRGMVTSTVTFARTIGGAMGVSALGAILNFLIRGDLQAVKDSGYTPAWLLDVKLHEKLPLEIQLHARSGISSGLQWVFVLMLAAAVAQLLVARMIPRGRHAPQVSAVEALEAGVN